MNGLAAAVRHVGLAGRRVAYTLRRSRRRSIGFTVGAGGLRVAAPGWVSLAAIEAALVARGPWIVRKLAEQQERAEQLDRARPPWRDGTSLPYLGGRLQLVLDGTRRGAVLDGDGDEDGDAAATTMPRHRTLRVGLPADADAAQVREAVRRWLCVQARELYAQRAAHYAARLGVQPARVTLTSARTRWGSAGVDGTVRLNWRLVHHDLPTIDYVVAHELAHLRHMHHGPAFWALVASVIPDVAAQRRRLAQGGLTTFD